MPVVPDTEYVEDIIRTGEWQSQFLPLEKIIQHVRETPPRTYKGVDLPFAGMALASNGDLLKAVKAALEKKGLRRFRYFGSGAFKLVLYTTEDQLVSLGRTNCAFDQEHERVHSPIMLGTIPGQNERVTVGGKYMDIDLFPKVKIRGDSISDRDVKVMRESAQILGYIPAPESPKNEICPGNLCLMENGTPILIDSGALVKDPRDNRTEAERMEALMEYQKKCGYVWVLPDGRWQQHVEHPELLTGKLKGVVTARQLEDIEKMEGNRTLRDIVEQRGLYHKEADDLLMRLAANGGNETQTEFALRLEVMRELYARNRERGNS